MLDPQEVSNLIEEKLNEIGKAWHDPYTFKLFSEIGEDNGGADEAGHPRFIAPQDPDPGREGVRLAAEVKWDAGLCQPLQAPFRARAGHLQPRHAEEEPDHPPHPAVPPSP